MLDLGFWTTLVNLFALASAEWLGFYIVTRSPRSLLSWLTALVLWSLGAYFFYNALVVNTTVSGAYAWPQQIVIIVAPLWFHITVLLARPRTGRAVLLRDRLNRIAVPVFYLYTVALIGIGLSSRLVVIPVSSNSVYYQNAPGPLYPLVILLFLFCLVPSLLNLQSVRRLTRDPEQKTRIALLIVATLLTVLGGMYLATNLLLGTGMPALVGDLFLTAGVLLLGYTVARYSAFLEGRNMSRDFAYTLLVVGALTLFYALVVLILFLGDRLSFLALELTIVGVIAANSLFDGVRVSLDRVFYEGRFRELRANLRALSREAGVGQDVDRRLRAVLASTCHAMQISGGFVALRHQDAYVVRATQDALPLGHTCAFEVLDAREMVGLALPTRKGLQGMTLLVPLIANDAQIGALVLGAREQNIAFEESDLELLEDLGDEIARLLYGINSQQEHAQELNALVVAYRVRERELELQLQQLVTERQTASHTAVAVMEWDEKQLITYVEDALRHIHDYPYLGEHPLANLKSVRAGLDKLDASTLLERGKAVSAHMVVLLNTLKPDAPAPKANQVPLREWHLYLILYDSYVLEETNREVMSKLYISEGTFSRTRRRAIHALAKALAETENRNSLTG